jgi:hypothetical protein
VQPSHIGRGTSSVFLHPVGTHGPPVRNVVLQQPFDGGGSAAVRLREQWLLGGRGHGGYGSLHWGELVWVL